MGNPAVSIPSGAAFGYQATSDLVLDQSTHDASVVAEIPSGTYAETQTPGVAMVAASKTDLLHKTTDQTRKLRYPPSIITRFASGHGWTFTPAGSTTGNDDTVNFVVGSQSVQVVTDGAGSLGIWSVSSLTAADLSNHFLRVIVKVSDLSRVAELSIWATSSSGSFFFNIVDSSTNTLKYVTAGEWAIVTIPWKPSSTSGTPDRTKITGYSLRAKDKGTGAITVNFNGVDHVPNGKDVYPNGVVTLSFDDTYLSQFTQAKPYLDKYGFPGVAHTIVEKVGTAGSLTLAQLQELERVSGWEIAGHAYTLANHNANYTTLTDAQVQAEFELMKKWLLDNGFKGGDHYAYPGGQYTASVLDIGRRYLASSRTVYDVDNGGETFPPSDYLRLRAKAGSAALAQLQALVDTAYAEGGWANIYFHDIVPGGTTSGNTCSLADFQTIIDYIATKGIPVRTVRQVAATTDNSLGYALVGAAATADIGTYGVKSSLYYGPRYTNVATVTTNINQMRAVPIDIGKVTTFSVIGAEVSGAVASSTVRLGIYSTGGDGMPNALVLDAGTIDSTTTGAKDIAISQTLQPGRYWLAYACQGTTGVGVIGTSGSQLAGVPRAANTQRQAASVVHSGTVSGALPATWVYSTTVADGAMPYLKPT